MKIRFSLFICFVLLFSTACGKSNYPLDVNDIPVDTSDLDVAIETVEQSVKQYLPDAKYVRLVFKSPCNTILDEKGEIVIIYTQEKRNTFLLTDQVLNATVVIDLKTDMYSFTITDESAHNISTDQYPIATNEQLDSVIESANDHFNLDGEFLPSCQVIITQLDLLWSIDWYQDENDGHRDGFCIDGTTYEITDCS
jgi:hypothetical protein